MFLVDKNFLVNCTSVETYFFFIGSWSVLKSVMCIIYSEVIPPSRIDVNQLFASLSERIQVDGFVDIFLTKHFLLYLMQIVFSAHFFL